MDAKLVIFKSNGQRKDISLSTPTTVIGRGEECEIRVPLLNVSRRHCELTKAGGTIKIKDLASSNGTYVNNKRINEGTLKPGDRMVVGSVVFTVQIDGEPADITPIKTRGQAMAEASEGDDVVNLEADAADEVVDMSEQIIDDIDPIAALEAMASQSDTKKKRK